MYLNKKTNVLTSLVRHSSIYVCKEKYKDQGLLIFFQKKCLPYLSSIRKLSLVIKDRLFITVVTYSPKKVNEVTQNTLF